MLDLQGVSKSYGSRTLFRDVTHHFGPGLFALQGPNGIGKSTLLALLSGAQPMDAGDVWVHGHSLRRTPVAAKRRLSYVPDECPVYPFLTGRQFLELVASVKRCALATPVIDLVEQFGLGPYIDIRFDAMSLGTQKKFLLTAAWIGDPSVMLVDEPDNALDAASTNLLAARYRDMAEEKLVLFSTHNREFAAAAGAEVVTLATLTREKVGAE